MKAEDYDTAYVKFVEDLGGLIWHYRAVHGCSFQYLAKEAKIHEQTVRRLANRETAAPQLPTVWALLRAMESGNIIRHSMLEKYRGLNSTRALKRAA